MWSAPYCFHASHGMGKWQPPCASAPRIFVPVLLRDYGTVMQAPYTDVGWVDKEADPFKWAKNLFGGKKETPKEDEKEAKGQEKRK